MSKQVIEQEVLGQVLGPLADNERLKRESKTFAVRLNKIFKTVSLVVLPQITFN